jgi:YtkA-like protein
MRRTDTKYAWPLMLAFMLVACNGTSTTLTELQRVKSGMLEIVVLSPHDALKHGKDTLVIEFRSTDGTLVDVGDVKGGASMSMSGTPMLGSVDVKRGDQTGQYIADTQLDMAGTWRMTLEWKGPAGSGSASFSSSAQ